MSRINKLRIIDLFCGAGGLSCGFMKGENGPHFESVLALDNDKAAHLLRDLGSSLINEENCNSARDRILAYLFKYPRVVIHGDELLVVAGISEYARRIRELRVQFGWPVLSGTTLREMIEQQEITLEELQADSLNLLKTDV